MKKLIVLSIILGIALQTTAFAIQEPTSTSTKKIRISRNKKDQVREYTLPAYWSSYNDEYLNKYIDEALENNFDLKIAKSRIKQSEAILGTINSQRLPQLSINPSVYPYKTMSKWTGNFASHNHLYFPLLFNWELDIFGKISDKVKSSKYQVKISEENLNIAKLAITSEMTASYFNIILSDCLIKNYQEIITNLEETITLKRQLYDGGIIPYDNLYTTEYEVVVQRNTLNSLLKQREILLHQFAVLRGLSPEGNSDIERKNINELKLPFEEKKDINSDLIFNRPDVVQSELELKKAAIDVRVARKMFLPSVNLNEMIGFENIRGGRIFNWDSTVYQLGAGLLLDLYTGGYKMSYLRYNKELATEKLFHYNNVLLNAFCEIENNLSSFKTDYNSYIEFNKATEKSEHYHEVAMIRYNNGIGNKIDALDARRQVLNNLNSMYGAKISSLVDTVNIYKSLGGSL